jgi:hypothetical protein
MTEVSTTSVDALRREVRVPPGDFLYAMADSARAPELVEAARKTKGIALKSLLIGPMGNAIAQAAPYIIGMALDSPFMENWSRHFGGSAGILLTTPADMDTLFEHLRDIFIAKTEDGEKYYFRYYDPRVLRGYLPTCTREEVGHFFGPIRAFYVEGEEPGVLLRYRNGPPAQRLLLQSGAGRSGA